MLLTLLVAVAMLLPTQQLLLVMLLPSVLLAVACGNILPVMWDTYIANTGCVLGSFYRVVQGVT